MGRPLPDAHAVGWSEVKFLSRLHIESCVPGIYIAHRGGPVPRGGMRIRHHLPAQRSFRWRTCYNMGNLSVEDEFTVPTAEEIRNAGLGPRRTVWPLLRSRLVGP
jgi:hypothetical protein